MELDDMLFKKAVNAKSAEELLSLAKENGVELTEGEAETYFLKLNSKEGELADDELDSVAGGKKCATTYFNHMPVITAFNSCDLFIDEKTYEKSDGYCKDCYFSRTVASDVHTPLLVCSNGERYDN